jgi:hypothetical protein
MVPDVKSAFAELRRRGIIAVRNAGYTMSDGWSVVAEHRSIAERVGEKPRGGVFYHGQDAARARNGETLMLAFGSFVRGARHEAASEALGREIVEVLTAHGFSLAWSGSVNSRIEILGGPAKTTKKPAVAKATKVATKPAAKKTAKAKATKVEAKPAAKTKAAKVKSAAKKAAEVKIAKAKVKPAAKKTAKVKPAKKVSKVKPPAKKAAKVKPAKPTAGSKVPESKTRSVRRRTAKKRG